MEGKPAGIAAKWAEPFANKTRRHSMHVELFNGFFIFCYSCSELLAPAPADGLIVDGACSGKSWNTRWTCVVTDTADCRCCKF